MQSKESKPSQAAGGPGAMPGGMMTSASRSAGMPTGAMDAGSDRMPRGDMRSAAGAGMPRGDMRATPAGDMPSGHMRGTPQKEDQASAALYTRQQR